MATTKPMSRIIPISNLPWEDRQPGVKRKILWEDAPTKRQAILTRIGTGRTWPRRWRPSSSRRRSMTRRFGCSRAAASR